MTWDPNAPTYRHGPELVANGDPCSCSVCHPELYLEPFDERTFDVDPAAPTMNVTDRFTWHP